MDLIEETVDLFGTGWCVVEVALKQNRIERCDLDAAPDKRTSHWFVRPGSSVSQTASSQAQSFVTRRLGVGCNFSSLIGGRLVRKFSSGSKSGFVTDFQYSTGLKRNVTAKHD
jgi:hypothetical protein